MTSIRKLIRQTLMETYGPSTVQYSAVVIEDPIEEQKIKDLASQYVPTQGWRLPYHYHMTISQGPIPESLELRGDLNKEVELTINMIGSSDKAIAFGTYGYYSKNEMPHITIGFSKKGGMPADSKTIQEWTQINPIKVKGIVREIGFGNKILKESTNDKARVDFEAIANQGAEAMDIIVGDKVVGDFYMYNNRKHPEYLTINKIEIYPEYRKLGYATEALRQILEYADNNNLITTLTPEAYKTKGLSTSELIEWYKSFGFVTNKGEDKDSKTVHLMYRLPSELREELDSNRRITSTSIKAYPGIPAEFPQEKDYDQFGNKVGDLEI